MTSNEGEDDREEVKGEEIMDLFSPINLMRVEKGRGGLRISGTHAGNSESGHSVSGGSFSGSGQKGSSNRIKSLKSSHTIEKTYSDFFNLTQESGQNLDQMLVISGGNQLPVMIQENMHEKHPSFQHSQSSP
jgi:hypothetical protein